MSAGPFAAQPVGPGWRSDANPAAASDSVGKAVHVEAFDHTRHNGTLVSLTDTHVTIRNMAGAVTLPLTEVRGIRRQTHAILAGTLVGLGGGAGAGLVLCAASGGCGEEGAWVILMTMGIGAGAGGGIGAIHNLTTADTRTIYVNPRKSEFSVMPIVGKQRAGSRRPHRLVTAAVRVAMAARCSQRAAIVRQAVGYFLMLRSVQTIPSDVVRAGGFL